MMLRYLAAWLFLVAAVVKGVRLDDDTTASTTTTTTTATDPTPQPTVDPTADPTPEPTAGPTPEPTAEPTLDPSPVPTPTPTPVPTPQPTEVSTSSPTAQPTENPTQGPTSKPTPDPTPSPSPGPTPDPTPSPKLKPTGDPKPRPTPVATGDPMPQPSAFPTPYPTPTIAPTIAPTPGPTDDAPANAPKPSVDIATIAVGMKKLKLKVKELLDSLPHKKEQAACDCMWKWSYKGHTHSGCAETHDWPGHSWCFVLAATACEEARESIFSMGGPEGSDSGGWKECKAGTVPSASASPNNTAVDNVMNKAEWSAVATLDEDEQVEHAKVAKATGKLEAMETKAEAALEKSKNGLPKDGPGGVPEEKRAADATADGKAAAEVEEEPVKKTADVAEEQEGPTQ